VIRSDDCQELLHLKTKTTANLHITNWLRYQQCNNSSLPPTSLPYVLITGKTLGDEKLFKVIRELFEATRLWYWRH